MENQKIVFELVETNYLTRWPCHICGGNTEKEPVLCEVLEGTNKGLRVCESCLKHRDFDNNLERFAEMLERHAQEIRALIGRVEAPSYEEWETAIQKHNERMETANKCSCPDCQKSGMITGG